MNAISRELQVALTEAFARADADPATSVVLLRAADQRIFADQRQSEHCPLTAGQLRRLCRLGFRQ